MRHALRLDFRTLPSRLAFTQQLCHAYCARLQETVETFNIRLRFMFFRHSSSDWQGRNRSSFSGAFGLAFGLLNLARKMVESFVPTRKWMDDREGPKAPGYSRGKFSGKEFKRPSLVARFSGIAESFAGRSMFFAFFPCTK